MLRTLVPTIRRHLLDFCYPGVCAACEASCDGASPLCDECLGGLETLEAVSYCDRCAKPLAMAGAPCPWCVGDGVYPYQQVARLGTFPDPLKHLIHQMKYHRRWTLAEYFGERLWGRPKVREILESADCIVAVPLYRWRHIARGYNQALVLARYLAHRAKKPVVRPIIRIRATETQTHLHSHEKRIENLRDAFGLIDPRCVRDRNVVVVDDVMTSGATLQSVGRTLLEADPQSLAAIVIASADPKGKNFESV